MALFTSVHDLSVKIFSKFLYLQPDFGEMSERFNVPDSKSGVL